MRNFGAETCQLVHGYEMSISSNREVDQVVDLRIITIQSPWAEKKGVGCLMSSVQWGNIIKLKIGQIFHFYELQNMLIDEFYVVSTCQ